MLALVSALLSLAGATRAPGIVTFALVPVVVFGFMDTMYLAQERAYRKLYSDMVGKIRDKTYALDVAYGAGTRPLTFNDFFSALKSWSIFPVYLSLLVSYLIVTYTGWLAILLTAPK